MNKTVALSNGNSIMLMIAMLIGTGVAIWEIRGKLKELFKQIFDKKEKTSQEDMMEQLDLLYCKQRIEEDEN